MSLRRNGYYFITILALASCGPRASGDIGRACAASDRPAASSALCSCIQTVANQSLSASDQQRAARFFADPDLAQSTRQADGASNEAFWDRYTAFAERARLTCG